MKFSGNVRNAMRNNCLAFGRLMIIIIAMLLMILVIMITKIIEYKW